MTKSNINHWLYQLYCGIMPIIISISTVITSHHSWYHFIYCWLIDWINFWLWFVSFSLTFDFEVKKTRRKRSTKTNKYLIFALCFFGFGFITSYFLFSLYLQNDDDPIHIISGNHPPISEKPPEYDSVVLEPPSYDDAIKLDPANLLQTKLYTAAVLPNYNDLATNNSNTMHSNNTFTVITIVQPITETASINDCSSTSKTDNENDNNNNNHQSNLQSGPR